MLRWFRPRARITALAVLWSMTALAGLSALPHEVECADEPEAVAVHRAGGHAIGAVRTSGDPLHCLLCHWIRSFSADGIKAPRIAVARATSIDALPAIVQQPRAAAPLNLVSRAPPV